MSPPLALYNIIFKILTKYLVPALSSRHGKCPILRLWQSSLNKLLMVYYKNIWPKNNIKNYLFFYFNFWWRVCDSDPWFHDRPNPKLTISLTTMYQNDNRTVFALLETATSGNIWQQVVSIEKTRVAGFAVRIFSLSNTCWPNVRRPGVQEKDNVRGRAIRRKICSYMVSETRF